eukprot:TRINITY_DN66893_c6_g12_i1.p1 TRINITY_DN66893_c6_g12~~TRINITY_DN66893_c6_g12_i1.p1  ORF type:complete len:562 (-),score=53.98 TRINITY_DN66893_c6_g12_i1:116-1801(-)
MATGPEADNENQTLFEILGVNETDTDESISKAFRKLALKYHPDKNPDGAEIFKKLQNAYDILSDTEQKQQYVALLNQQRAIILRGGAFDDLRMKMQNFYDYKRNHATKYERTCRDWAKGRCRNEHCPYWHYHAERQKRHSVCKDFLMGTCKFGDECIYMHTNVIPKNDDDAIYIKEWRCKNCDTSNDLGKQMCKGCKQRRVLSAPKFNTGSTVILNHDKTSVLDEIIRRTLFLIEDGKTKTDVTQMVTAMKQMNIFGQVLGTVVEYYPTAEIYLVRSLEGQSFMVADSHLQTGSNRWTCERCKYLNAAELRRCKLCSFEKDQDSKDRRRGRSRSPDHKRRRRDSRDRDRYDYRDRDRDRRDRRREDEDDRRSSRHRRERSQSPSDRDRERRHRDRSERDRRDKEKDREKSSKKEKEEVISPEKQKELDLEKQWKEAKAKRQAEREARIAARKQNAPPPAPTPVNPSPASITMDLLNSGMTASAYGAQPPQPSYPQPPVASGLPPPPPDFMGAGMPPMPTAAAAVPPPPPPPETAGWGVPAAPTIPDPSYGVPMPPPPPGFW